MRALIVVLLFAVTAYATAPKLLLPTLGGTIAEVYPSGSGTANVLVCATVPAEHGLANVSKIAFYNPGTQSLSDTCAAAVYPDSDGGTKLGGVSAPCAAGVISATGLTPFSITEGTLYRICVCSTAGNTTTKYLAVRDDYGTAGNYHLPALGNTFATHYGAGANTCTSGVLPSTTGALTPYTQSSFKRIPVILLEQ